MDNISRMVAMLARMRRERNGAVADAMRCYGSPCGLNYGVSLPTIRQIARAEQSDHNFARLLWQQDVRELRLAALHVAEPEHFTLSEAAQWEAGLINAELAEEMAFALLSRTEHFSEIFAQWIASPKALLRYTALLGGTRSPLRNIRMLAPALQAIRHPNAAASRLIARGTVALLEVLGKKNETNRQAIRRAIAPADNEPSAMGYVREELAWRLDTAAV